MIPCGPDSAATRSVASTGSGTPSVGWLRPERAVTVRCQHVAETGCAAATPPVPSQSANGACTLRPLTRAVAERQHALRARLQSDAGVRRDMRPVVQDVEPKLGERCDG